MTLHIWRKVTKLRAGRQFVLLAWLPGVAIDGEKCDAAMAADGYNVNRFYQQRGYVCRTPGWDDSYDAARYGAVLSISA